MNLGGAPLPDGARFERARYASTAFSQGLSGSLHHFHTHQRGGQASGLYCAHGPSTFRLCAVCEHAATGRTAIPPLSFFLQYIQRDRPRLRATARIQ
jgi:hypothetical protein